MEAFNFQLQRVLDFKAGVEEKKKEEFVKALKYFLTQEKALNDLLLEKNKSQNYFSGLRTIDEFQSYSRYIDFLEKRIENSKYNLFKAQEQLENKKQELMKSTADRKVLEKLREKAKEDFEYEINSKEQKQNDDFALFSFVKQERR